LPEKHWGVENASMSQRDGLFFDVTTGRQILCVMLLALAGIAPAQSPGATPTVEIIVERMARARADNRSRLRPYVVTRDYALFGKEKNTTTSEVTAQLTFVPPNSKKYNILQRSGSGLGERLVRRMLDGETTIVKEYSSTDISPDNYDFRFSGEESVSDRRCSVIEILPKRATKTLLRGTIWVDAATYLLHRMEGEPAESPSWWLRDARITFFYSDVKGMWLQTASEFTTHVRIFGQHTMISRDVKYETAAVPGAAATLATESRSRAASHEDGSSRRGVSRLHYQQFSPAGAGIAVQLNRTTNKATRRQR
jgi:hypothetical protein